MAIGVLFPRGGIEAATIDDRTVFPGIGGSSLLARWTSIPVRGIGMISVRSLDASGPAVAVGFESWQIDVPDRTEEPRPATGFDAATQRDVLQTGMYGHIWARDIHVSTMLPAPALRPPLWHHHRRLPSVPYGIHQDVVHLPADDPANLRLGWVIHEEVGVAVINDYATARISIGGEYTNPIWHFYRSWFAPGSRQVPTSEFRRGAIERFHLVKPMVERFRIRRAGDG